MNTNEWKNEIKSATNDIGTYKEAFNPVIDALAKILAQRDAVYERFIDEGAIAVVERVSDRGAVNSAKNPLLIIWDNLNTTALKYWKELGLTPAGLKQIKNGAVKEETEASPLVKALAKMSSER